MCFTPHYPVAYSTTNLLSQSTGEKSQLSPFVLLPNSLESGFSGSLFYSAQQPATQNMPAWVATIFSSFQLYPEKPWSGWYLWHFVPSQPSSLPSLIRVNPQQQLIHWVKSKTLDAAISSSGITLNLHLHKTIKSQISRIQLVGEILAYIKGVESKSGHRWCFIQSSLKTTEFGAAPGLCQVPAAVTDSGDLLNHTGLWKCGILWLNLLCPWALPFFGK